MSSGVVYDVPSSIVSSVEAGGVLVLYWPAELVRASQSLVEANTAVQHAEACVALFLGVRHGLLNELSVLVHQCHDHFPVLGCLGEELTGPREVVTDWP